MILRKLTIDDEAAFVAGAALWPRDQLFWYSFEWTPGASYPEMLRALAFNEAGIALPDGRVANTMLYGFASTGEIVGRLHIRHTLNEKLRARGGHMGYAVAPVFRRRGYATEIFRLGLSYVRHVLGPTEVMLSCADDNEPSWKMIEREGGVLEDRVWDERASELIRRYWIRF